MISVDKCLFINRAPFKENLEISFKEGVNVLCGINGRGKTTILSYIVDALSKIHPKIDALTKPLVITEGKTDWKHLKKALEHFRSNGQYTDLDFELLEYSHDFGDSKLDGALKHYAQFPNRFKIVGIFDCD